MSRYARCFARLAARGEGAFVPFVMLGDPDLPTSARVLRALLEAGADALEVGVPFSDPIADGPTIQAAACRALGAGATVAACFRLVADLRTEAPEIPVGVLTYANLVVRPGRERFYERAGAAGVDSVLVADVPALEAGPFVDAARNAGVAPVLIAPPDATDEALARIAGLSEGYTYCLARAGVTGADESVRLSHARLFGRLAALGAPPAVVGFGISRPEHVRAVLEAGAQGAISGSAVVQRVAEHLGDPGGMVRALRDFVSEMKAATGRG
jgi:tryptophan synthase alpha chain